MKRNLWKITLASVGALSLGLSNPVLAAGGDGLTGSGTTPDIITLDITSPSANLTYGAKKLTGSFTLDYATNVIGKKLAFSFGSAITTPLETGGLAQATYKLTMALSGGTGDGAITYTPQWTTLARAATPTTQNSQQLEAGVVVTGATVDITLERDDSTSKEMIAGPYALPAVITIVSGS